MYLNISDFTSNITSSVNQNEVHRINYYEAYKITGQISVYKCVSCVVGILIILSNILVVISSGLILKKGMQPKSTYLLLGNISLADTIVGLSLILRVTIDNPLSSNIRCIFQIGILSCPAMVSTFSVGLIAIDRYIYILHGLYYQRWFNTRRVRIGILCIWIISFALSFLPGTGWTNTELNRRRCYYENLFPGELILLNSILSIVIMAVVVILYSVILVQVLKNVNNIKSNIKIHSKNKTKQLQIYSETVSDKNHAAYPNRSQTKNITIKSNRSLSLNANYKQGNLEAKRRYLSSKAKSSGDIVNGRRNIALNCHGDRKCEEIKADYKSNISVYTMEQNYSIKNSSITDTTKNTRDVESNANKESLTIHNVREPNKWRGISIVTLTSGCFIFTCLPFVITMIFFVFCEDKLTNPKCKHIESLLGGPLVTLGFFNSILNPLIYAWWHKGFKKSFLAYYRKCLQNISAWTKK